VGLGGIISVIEGSTSNIGCVTGKVMGEDWSALGEVMNVLGTGENELGDIGNDPEPGENALISG